MTDREAIKSRFLLSAGFSEAERHPLPGDASTRRYERLIRPDGATFMLMDQPPAIETQPCRVHETVEERQASGYNAMARLAAGRIEAFVGAAHYLRDQGLSAPEIFEVDTANGLLISEDLGDDLFARLIETGADETPLYLTAIEAQAQLHELPAPTTLDHDWPLLSYDDLALKTGAGLFVEWYPKYDPTHPLSDTAISEWEALWSPLRQRAEAGATTFIHRDYHAENLLWLPDREGTARVGMIDFQDCLRAHPSWDLLSLLQDARRDVSRELEAKCLDHYFGLRPHVDRAAFMQDYSALATLNEARILGIFARLVVHFKKPRYEAFIPRMWGHIARNIREPGMEGLQDWFMRYGFADKLGRMIPQSAPKTAFILAAGLGTRMRPLTDDRPKALVEVAGRTLIDHMLDRLRDAGAKRFVVNVHYFADRLEAHLKARSDLHIVISDERDALLETGGGLKKARPLLGEEPIWVANIDSVWLESDPDGTALRALSDQWNGDEMDAALLVTAMETSHGFDGAGDFFLNDGHLAFRGEAEAAPFNYMGVHITKQQIVDAEPEGAFSLSRIWRRLAPEGRLHGTVFHGEWMHVGDPGARDYAEAQLTR